MDDFRELMQWLSIPRLSGSPAEEKTRGALLDWLDSKEIRYDLHTFRLYPYFFVIIGLWLIASRSLLAWAIWARWGWITSVIALIGLLGGLVDVALDFPLIAWPGAKAGKNIIITHGPETADQELVLSAHYDSKTELLDHRQRMFFIMNLPLGIFLTVALGLIGPIDRALYDLASTWSPFWYGGGIALSLPLLFLAWGLGLNLSLGRLRKAQSQGSVDNGAACAVLLGLAEQLSHRRIQPKRTRVTLALFSGEEVNMQGSKAYVRSRDWKLPAIALNLEVMAQNGEYVYWEQDGTSLKLMPTSPVVNQLVVQTVSSVTGSPPLPAGPVNSDGYSFIRAGIPASTLGTYDLEWRDRGFHLPSDNLERVVMERIPEAVDILTELINQYDDQGATEDDFI